MTIEEACEILGCTESETKKEIKKKYHKLLHKFHPDTTGKENDESARIQKIIEAYKFLTKDIKKENLGYTSKKNEADKKKTKNWNAPINEHAYTSRKIFQYVEDYEGEVIGNIVVDEGKYFWTTEEDFPLFLKSIYECTNKILEGIDQEKKIKIQPQISYLLAEQFVDAKEVLKKLCKEEKKEIFFTPSMLELNNNIQNKLEKGMILYPRKISNHKLYIQDKNKNELGYLSFKDDRLYYCLIPLFEQKTVQVKMCVSKEQDKNLKKYKNVDLWIRLTQLDTNALFESINAQIEKIIIAEKST